MEAFLQTIQAMAGVQGVFLLGRNRVLARRFPAYLTTETLAETAPAVWRVFDEAAVSLFEAVRLVLEYEDGRLLVERLGAGRILVVSVAPGAEIQDLVQRLEAVRRDLGDVLGGAGPDRPGEGEVASAEGAAPAVDGRTRVAREGWTAEEKAQLREVLARYVGPVASLIVETAMRHATTRRILVETLAREIELPQDREAFLRDVETLGPLAPEGEGDNEAKA